MISKCEQDPPSIPDVLEALQGHQTWETPAFFLGTDSLRGCGCDKENQHSPGPGRSCSSIPAWQNLSCPCPGWDTSPMGLAGHGCGFTITKTLP